MIVSYSAHWSIIIFYHYYHASTADPDATCPDDNICEQLCGLNITTSNTASSGSGSGIGSGTGSGSGSGTGTGTGTGDFSAIVCACLNGFTLDDSLANCTGILLIILVCYQW